MDSKTLAISAEISICSLQIIVVTHVINVDNQMEMTDSASTVVFMFNEEGFLFQLDKGLAHAAALPDSSVTYGVAILVKRAAPLPSVGRVTASSNVRPLTYTPQSGKTTAFSTFPSNMLLPSR